MSKFSKALEQAELDGTWARSAEPEDPARRPQQPAPDREGDKGEASEGQAAGRVIPEVTEDAGRGLDEHLASLLAPGGFEAEQYRGLRHALEEARGSASVFVVAVTSAVVREGKTTTAINLAGALGQAPESRVLLLEADLRQPSIAERLALGGPASPGLVDLIVGRRLSLDDAVRRLGTYNLDVLPAGRLVGSPYEILHSSRFVALGREARRRYDYVVIDAPPLVAIQDCQLIEKLVDAFIVVVGAHRTPRKSVQQALQLIQPGKLLGTVLNGDNRSTRRYYPGRDVVGTRRRAGWIRRLLSGRRSLGAFTVNHDV